MRFLFSIALIIFFCSTGLYATESIKRPYSFELSKNNTIISKQRVEDHTVPDFEHDSRLHYGNKKRNIEAIKVVEDKIIIIKEYRDSIVKIHPLYSSSDENIHVREYNAIIKDLENLISDSNNNITMENVLNKINKIQQKYHPEDDL